MVLQRFICENCGKEGKDENRDCAVCLYRGGSKKEL